MRIRFLGTGTSFGVPVIGCGCPVCTSDDPRNRRSRHGLLVEEGGRRLLVDTPPELRLQLLAAGVGSVDAVWISHPHADHVHGIDDLRAFTTEAGRRVPLFVPAEHEAEMRSRFAYFLGPDASAQPGTTVPGVDLVTFEDREMVEAAGMEVRAVAFPHGAFRSYGMRVGGLALVIDARRIPDDAYPLLAGARVLVLNALWWGAPHPTHFNVEEALEAAACVGAERTFLTHLTHRLDHADLSLRLPTGVEPAYDGLEVEI